MALIISLVLLAALLRFDAAREPTNSLSLWVPVLWMVIAGSRLPSQWLAGSGRGASAQALEQGNPLDRTIYSALIVLSIGILVSRSFKWADFLRQNPVLAAYLCFCLLSVLWSDFPLIALKRWFRDVGDYFTMLVVLSDRRPLEAVRTVLRRLCFLLIPLSVVMIKYYPALGVHYDFWTGAPEFTGAALSKNTLGGLCVVSGLVFFWDTARRWPERKNRRARQTILINATFIVMTLWLLHLSNSVTSQVCLIIACSVVAWACSKWGKRKLLLLKWLMPGSFLLYLVLNLAFDMNGQLAAELGRTPTLTGRTEIWRTLLATHTNPLLGTGYESFWLGPRLEWIWQQRGHINEAHNGYLDIYLNLGLIGLLLVLLLLVTSYRTICRRLSRDSGLAPLAAATWTLLLFYCVTEAAFKSGLLWMMFLLGTVAIPPTAEIGKARKREHFTLQPGGSRPREAVGL
ncbi:MAG: O-antigen ligase family protein [Terracidiphilus sp.]